MNKLLVSEVYQFYNMLPRTFIYTNNIMPSHYGGSKMKEMKMSDKDYYAEHSKNHSPKHIKAMKELQKMGIERAKAHTFAKKYIDK
jgi:urocanate hydratase